MSGWGSGYEWVRGCLTVDMDGWMRIRKFSAWMNTGVSEWAEVSVDVCERARPTWVDLNDRDVCG